MLMRRQVTAPVWAVSVRLRELRDDRLPRRRRAGEADDVEGGVVEEAEIGAAFADRQVLRQVPVRAERAHAELGDRRGSSSRPAGSISADEHVGAGVVGGLAVAPLLGGAPPRQPPHRVEEAGVGAAGLRRRIERADRHLLAPAEDNARRRRGRGAARSRAAGCDRARHGIRAGSRCTGMRSVVFSKRLTAGAA